MLEKEENDKVYCDKVYIPSPDFLWSGPVDTRDSGGGMEVKRRGLGLRFKKKFIDNIMGGGNIVEFGIYL